MAQSAHHDLAPRTDTQLTPKHAANGIHGSSTCLDAQAGINSVFDLNSQHPTPLNTLLNTKRRRKRRQRMRGDEQRETGRATRPAHPPYMVQTSSSSTNGVAQM
ncbi:hypothetical protein PTI98_009274 [Pleurotus ostreatus]|nr:hypothetical protein PTI98_009274 [Pleurotus ostreatus]